MGFLQQAGKSISSSKSSGGFLQQAGVSNLSENTKTTPAPKKTEPISKPIRATTPAQGFLSQATSTASRLIGDIKMTLAPKKQEIVSPVPDSQLIPQSSNPIRIKPDQKKIAKDVIKQIFPQTVENVKQIVNDPLAMKDTRMQARKDTWEAIKQPVVTAFQNSLQDYVNPPKTQAQKIARTLTKVTDIAGVAFIPISAIFTMAEHVPVVGSFIKAITTAVAIAPSEGAHAISDKVIDELPINQQAKDSLKPAVGDMAGLVAQIVTGKFIGVGSKKSASIIKKVGLDRFEKLTKDTIESTGSPKTINLTKTQVRDVLRGLGSEQAKQVFKDLGVSDRIKAVKEGLTIQIPAEKIVRIIDKPYWEKIKSVFNIEATDTVKVDKGTTTTTAGFAGYLTDGTYTPAEVSAKIIGSPLENTPEGRAVMKTVLEAQQTGQDITVQQEKVVKSPSPIASKPSRGVVEQGSVEPQSAKEIIAKDYTTASDYAEAKYSATETQQIGEIDPNRIIPRDPVDKTSREYKALMEDIKTNGMKDPVRVTVEDGKITTTDGSQRSSIAQDLGIKARVIVNSGSIDGLKTIADEYNTGLKKSQAEEFVGSKKTKLRVTGEKKDLVVLHNLSASGIDKANIEGGLPAPSLAITKKNIAFNDFGEISLVGEKGLVDPKRADTNVFSGDIYTPRVPQPQYTVKNIYNTPLGSELEKRNIYFGDFDSILPSDAIERLTRGYNKTNAYSYEEAEKIVNAIYSKPFLSLKKAKLGPRLKNFSARYPSLRKLIKETRDSYAFGIEIENDERLYDAVTRLANKEFDGEFNDALNALGEDLFENVPYNLENKVKKAKEIVGRNMDDIRGTEQGWGASANPRILGYTKMTSIEDIKLYRDSIVSKEKAEKIGSKAEDKLFKYLRKNKLGRDFSSTLEIFKDIVKGDKYDDYSFIKNYLKQFGGWESITDLQSHEIGILLENAYRNAPTDYFEAKLMRPVGLNEFKGALVPSDTLQSTINALERNGLKVVKYDQNIEGDRSAKLRANFKNEMFRLKDDFKALTGVEMTNAQEAELIKLNKRIFGDTDIKIVGQILANRDALGSYREGIIKVVAGQTDPKATLYHEAVHKYLDVFTTREEHVDLLMEAQSRYGIEDFAQVEEKVAEDFINYAKSREGFTGKLKLIFDQIIARIKAYFKSVDKIDQLYQDILVNKKKPIDIEADASLLTSEMAKQEAMKATPQSEKATAELKKMQEDIQQAQAENQMKKSILDQFSTSEIRAIRAIKRSVASLEAKGQDITGVSKTDSYQAYIENVMSAIKTDSEDVALQYIINDIPDAITSASTREDLQRIRVLKSRIQPKEVVVNKSQLPAGEGKIRVSRLEARMKGVLKKATPQQIEDLGLSTYNQMNRKETIQRAVEYVTTSPADALQVLKGSMEAPEGIPPEAIYVALTQEAKTDLTLATKLASLQATTLGQRLSLLAELDPNSPVKLMNEVYQLREKAMKKRYKSENVKQVREKVVKEIKKRVKAPDKYEWKSFIDSIDTC